MGRKIPGRKHRGVKDPLQQQAKRNATLQNKINAPPETVDFQEMPRSVERLMKINKSLKSGKMQVKKRRRKKNKKQKDGLINTEDLVGKDIMLPGMTKEDKPIPSFVQTPGETDNHFLHRISQECHEVIQQVKFEEKYGVNVSVDPDTGEVAITKQPRDEIDEIENSSCKKKRKKSSETKSNKNEKRKKKLEERKRMESEKTRDDFERFQDHVKFGETVHAPPTFKSLPRTAESIDIKERPGKRDLLLKSVLQTKTEPITTFSRKLPLAKKQQLELQRLQAIKAYRMLKGQK